MMEGRALLNGILWRDVGDAVELRSWWGRGVRGALSGGGGIEMPKVEDSWLGMGRKGWTVESGIAGCKMDRQKGSGS